MVLVRSYPTTLDPRALLTKLEPVVNLRPARALGVTIPPARLLRADRIID